jgi:hypothetical protein
VSLVSYSANRLQPPPAPRPATTGTPEMERVHIPQDGALGNLKLAREIASCHAPVHLQVQQDGKQPLSAHGSDLSQEYDIRCQESVRRLGLCRRNSR